MIIYVQKRTLVVGILHRSPLQSAEGEAMEFDTLETPLSSATSPQLSANTSLPTSPRDSAALRRLMDEVRCEDTNGASVATSYDRAHNRHNR